MTTDVLCASEVYGTHLMLRLGEVELVDKLDDRLAIDTFLTELVTGIGMRILDGPRTQTERANPKRYGHSGTVILYESHAAVHTYPRLRSLFLDLFSCKSFDVAAVMTIIRRFFGSFSIVESVVLDRGYHWGADADSELERWQGER